MSEEQASIDAEAEAHHAQEAWTDRAVWLATWKHSKGYDESTFRDCDYGSDLTTEQQDDVFELCDELDAIGSVAFREKYSRFKLYP